jgi:Zn-dependent peptidase ImmA (M78 family)
MSTKILLQEAEHEARSLLKRLELNCLPICPFKVAETHGIMVEPKTSDGSGISGCLMRVGNVFGIQYTTHIDSQGFINFTVAHELGHYFIPGHPEALFKGKNGIHKSRSGFISDDIYEKQADYFAKELLMPENLFKDAMRKSGKGFAAIESLASTCNTSLTATAIRFCLFSEDPVAVIMSNKNKIEWCFMSESLRSVPKLQWLKKGSIVPPITHTAEYNKNQDNILHNLRTEGWTNLGEWFEGGPEIEMQEDIIGLGTYGRTLTILFTEDAVDIEDDEDF